ncbi:MAG: fumarylacetoacetate hydrolase family protein [Acidimicrobiales bacterium]|nr:fumarylacetoacetate hydrolase family protein [Acidimicrobiales bacterium]
MRELLPDGGLQDGYEVQRLVHDRTCAARRRVGRKIGLTSAVVQQQMGVTTPDFGVLFDDMAYGDAEPIPFDRLLQPRIEAEVAFVLGADLPARTVTTIDVLRAVDFVVPAIEVCDSRIADWDISIFDTVADNASAGVFVTGAAPRRLQDIDDLRGMEMNLTSGGRILSSGQGAACLGHPVTAVVWLANQVAERGEPLQAGEVVLSGSLGRLVDAEAGATYEAVIDGLGSVRASFTGSDR